MEGCVRTLSKTLLRTAYTHRHNVDTHTVQIHTHCSSHSFLFILILKVFFFCDNAKGQGLWKIQLKQSGSRGQEKMEKEKRLSCSSVINRYSTCASLPKKIERNLSCWLSKQWKQDRHTEQPLLNIDIKKEKRQLVDMKREKKKLTFCINSSLSLIIGIELKWLHTKTAKANRLWWEHSYKETFVFACAALLLSSEKGAMSV